MSEFSAIIIKKFTTKFWDIIFRDIDEITEENPKKYLKVIIKDKIHIIQRTWYLIIVMKQNCYFVPFYEDQ